MTAAKNARAKARASQSRDRNLANLDKVDAKLKKARKALEQAQSQVDRLEENRERSLARLALDTDLLEGFYRAESQPQEEELNE